MVTQYSTTESGLSTYLLLNRLNRAMEDLRGNLWTMIVNGSDRDLFLADDVG
jgi:hypothetical protein